MDRQSIQDEIESLEQNKQKYLAISRRYDEQKERLIQYYYYKYEDNSWLNPFEYEVKHQESNSENISYLAEGDIEIEPKKDDEINNDVDDDSDDDFIEDNFMDEFEDNPDDELEDEFEDESVEDLVRDIDAVKQVIKIFESLELSTANIDFLASKVGHHKTKLAKILRKYPDKFKEVKSTIWSLTEMICVVSSEETTENKLLNNNDNDSEDYKPSYYPAVDPKWDNEATTGELTILALKELKRTANCLEVCYEIWGEKKFEMFDRDLKLKLKSRITQKLSKLSLKRHSPIEKVSMGYYHYHAQK